MIMNGEEVRPCDVVRYPPRDWEKPWHISVEEEPATIRTGYLWK